MADQKILFVADDLIFLCAAEKTLIPNFIIVVKNDAS